MVQLDCKIFIHQLISLNSVSLYGVTNFGLGNLEHDSKSVDCPWILILDINSTCTPFLISLQAC